MKINNLRSFNEEMYNESYYENGIKNKLSGYEDFHYIPTRSYSEAIEICDNFRFKTAIDVGCAKGFLVHALRQLNKEAYGEDISKYALDNCHPNVKKYLSLPNANKADLIICKDIFEHIYEDEIEEMLQFIINKCKNELFAIIPLGDNNTFRIREYEVDITHVTKKDEDWWIDRFRSSGFNIKSFRYNMGEIKKKWTQLYPYGNGFFTLNIKN